MVKIFPLVELPESHPNETQALGQTDVVFGRTVVPVPLKRKQKKKGKLGFEYTEHSYIGDAIELRLEGGNLVQAHDHKFTLDNGLVVTYGQINILAGEFYATENPISDGVSEADRSRRFMDAYNTLAAPSSQQPEEAEGILAALQTEVEAVNDAWSHNEDPSIAYAKLPDITAKLQYLTQFRPQNFPSYLGLARINWDRFGRDARIAYNAGHLEALKTAIDGDLALAYTLNAFADHFLEDSFAAGHLRTPRRYLHKGYDFASDLCAKYMHDEDSAIGLSVANSRGDRWTCYGDKRSLDKVNYKNIEYCIAAVQESANEVYNAYVTGILPETYRAWTIAPSLESARSPQELAPLFKYNSRTHVVDRREIVENRRMDKYISNWWYYSTALECSKSDRWSYPITIDGPSETEIVRWTNFAVVAPRLWAVRLYYQSSLGGVLESTYENTHWTSGTQHPTLCDAAPCTPLAAISWDDGKEIRVYYLSTEYRLQEICYINGKWHPEGWLNQMNILAARNTSIGALCFSLDGFHIRVYCQEEGSDNIREICYDNGRWSRGATLPLALAGTSIAAVSYQFQGLKLRVYYQAPDLSIREHCYEKGWFPGKLNGGVAPSRAQINALIKTSNGPILDVYWVDKHWCITHRININGTWQNPEGINTVAGPLQNGAKFTVAQWENGKYIRVYYQSVNKSIIEVCQDEGGQWFFGMIKNLYA